MSNPVILLDPTGTVTTEVSFDTGSDNKEKPWVGAVWNRWTIGLPANRNAFGNPGLVRVSRPTVSCTCNGGKIECKISMRMRIELADEPGKPPNIRVPTGKPPELTEKGIGRYGHEQLHVKDYILNARELIDEVTKGLKDPQKGENCETAAKDARVALQAALDKFYREHQPGRKPDTSHGGAGQPVNGEPNPPEGEPGPFEPRRPPK